MKKFISVLMCVLMITCAFAGCSSSGGSDSDTTASTETTSKISIDDATIKDADAVNLIESYSDEELGLSADERKECSFMIDTSGVEIDNNKYVKVVAAIKTEHNDGDETTYTFDNKGEYYIRFDGKEILSMDMETGEYNKMEVKEVPTTEAPTTHAETTAKE
jgi:hypothetical protein